MNRKNLRLLVISDLHATCAASGGYSALKYENSESCYEEMFFQFLEKEGIDDIDILLCSGDIGTHGDEEAFKAGWRFLNKSKEKIGSAKMIAVPGNHDHISRPEMAFDPKHHLQFIDPPFPVEDYDLNTRFWAWHWCHFSGDDYNVVLLNSSAYHGYNEEYKHGRISFEVADQISGYLKSDSFPTKRLNIFVCHHHPVSMSSVDCSYDSEVMKGGDYLLDIIKGSGVGPWLFVHGHKHFPRIIHLTDGCDISILSAGSFSAKLHSSILGRTSNQFYILDVDMNKTHEEERVYSTFRTYEHATGQGWRHSTSDHLPAYGGFGNLEPPKRIVSKILNNINEDNPYLNETDILGLDLDLEYLSPENVERVKSKLTEKGLNYEFDRGKFISIGRKL